MAVLSLAIWGTFLTTFVVTLNNHLHGAIFFSISLALAWQILRAAQSQTSAPWNTWLSLGIATALCVACELPALAWATAIGAIVLLADPKRMLIGFGLGSASIAVAFLLTNLWAHGDWRPPYSHRGLGISIAKVELDLSSFNQATEAKADLKAIKALPEQQNWIATIREQTQNTHAMLTDQARIIPARLDGVYQVIDESTSYRVALAVSDPPSRDPPAKGTWKIYEWDDWYDYPKSYWLPGSKKGVDLGEPDRWNYVVHLLVGHHGVFSLTPIWFWMLCGSMFWLIQGPEALSRSTGYRTESLDTNTLKGIRAWLLSERGIAAALLSVTLACLVFYASREIEDRNYGGVSSGFRWLFWIIPGWIWLAIPALDRCASKPFFRGLVYLAIVLGIVSAVIPWGNPWSQPWPYRILMWLFPDRYQ